MVELPTNDLVSDAGILVWLCTKGSGVAGR